MKILAIGVSETSHQIINTQVADINWTTVSSPDDFATQYESWSDGDFNLIVVGTAFGIDFLFEAGQVTRNQCPATAIIALIEKKEDFLPKKIKKNGFSENFLIPNDRELLKDYIAKAGKKDIKGKVYKRIKSFDIKADSTLDFDTYLFLPRNNKYIKYSKANEKMEKRKVDKLDSHQESNLYIDSKAADSFYRYAANQFAGSAGNMSATEREEKAVHMIKELFSAVFDNEGEASFETGKDIIAMCQKVTSNIITHGADSNWYSKISTTLSGQMDDYNHATETSTLACFFAMAIGIDKVDDIAIAAFLHDLGMTDTPDFDPEDEVQRKDEAKLKLYLAHPERSINYIKNKRMIVSEKVTKAILTHHEMFNGKGFPKGLVGDRIPIEAQIISLADQFQYLTSVRPNKKKMKPNEALKAIFSNGSLSPAITTKLTKALNLK